MVAGFSMLLRDVYTSMGSPILHQSAGKYRYTSALKLSASSWETSCLQFLSAQSLYKILFPSLRKSSSSTITFLHEIDKMSSFENNNHSNGPSNANGLPNSNSSGAHPAPNGISPLLKISHYLTGERKQWWTGFTCPKSSHSQRWFSRQ